MKLPRVMLAGVSSGSGKTTITCGLLRALQLRGLRPRSFKCGPDYIDPMFHESVLQTPSRNLDTFFTDGDTTRYLFSKHAAQADISVVEGVMGYYDGLGGISTKASSYDVACTCDTPVILVVDTKGMSLSVVAIIKGFLSYKENHHIQGVILNCLSPMLYTDMKKQIEQCCNVQVLGYLPVMKEITMHSRHLGLLMPEEIDALQETITLLAKQMEQTIDIDKLIEIAGNVSTLPFIQPNIKTINSPVRIAIAKDEAFCFYYQDNLEVLTTMGAELVPFSPIHDTCLPNDIQGVYLPGGYPELYAKELSNNETMKTSIKSEIDKGLPFIAECGGFLYLHTSLEGSDKEYYDMVGIYKGSAKNIHKLTRFGYVELNVQKSGFFLKEDGICKAHEFHYYDSDCNGTDMYAQKPNRKRGWECVHVSEVSYAGFPHVYFYSNLMLPYRFLEACKRYGEKRYEN